MSDIENEQGAQEEKKEGLGEKIKGGLGKAKDKVAGALDTDGDGKIEFEDFKDRAADVGGKVKDGFGKVGGKIKDGFGKLKKDK